MTASTNSPHPLPVPPPKVFDAVVPVCVVAKDWYSLPIIEGAPDGIVVDVARIYPDPTVYVQEGEQAPVKIIAHDSRTMSFVLEVLKVVVHGEVVPVALNTRPMLESKGLAVFTKFTPFKVPRPTALAVKVIVI